MRSAPQVLGARTAMPALIGSAAHGNGITRLMKALRHEAPGPAALRDRLREQAGLDVAPSAVVFSGAHQSTSAPPFCCARWNHWPPTRRFDDDAGGIWVPPIRATGAISTRRPKGRSSRWSRPTI